jgi:phosphatidylglycerol:prolipoprotein diacylglycerol transferase
MHPELFAHPHIGSYSACLFVAFLLGYLLVRWRAVRLGIPGRHIDNVSLLVPPLSLFGARFFSWLFYMPSGIGFWQGMTMDGGGLVFYGGLIFALLTIVIYTLARRLSLGEVADAFAAPVMLGLAIGRVGCFMAGCCWGDICASSGTLAPIADPRIIFKVQTFPALSSGGFPLAVQYPREAGAFEQHTKLNLISPEAARSLPVHPVQLYEAGLAFLFCFLLHRNFLRRRHPGDIFWAMMIGYGLIRFTTEFFRADNSPAYGGLTISQVISVLFILVAGGALLARLRFAPRPRVAINPLP